MQVMPPEIHFTRDSMIQKVTLINSEFVDVTYDLSTLPVDNVETPLTANHPSGQLSAASQKVITIECKALHRPVTSCIYFMFRDLDSGRTKTILSTYDYEPDTFSGGGNAGLGDSSISVQNSFQTADDTATNRSEVDNSDSVDKAIDNDTSSHGPNASSGASTFSPASATKSQPPIFELNESIDNDESTFDRTLLSFPNPLIAKYKTSEIQSPSPPSQLINISARSSKPPIGEVSSTPEKYLSTEPSIDLDKKPMVADVSKAVSSINQEPSSVQKLIIRNKQIMVKPKIQVPPVETKRSTSSPKPPNRKTMLSDQVLPVESCDMPPTPPDTPAKGVMPMRRLRLSSTPFERQPISTWLQPAGLSCTCQRNTVHASSYSSGTERSACLHHHEEHYPHSHHYQQSRHSHSHRHSNRSHEVTSERISKQRSTIAINCVALVAMITRCLMICLPHSPTVTKNRKRPRIRVFGTSVVVCVLAAANLLLSFYFIVLDPFDRHLSDLLRNYQLIHLGDSCTSAWYDYQVENLTCQAPETTAGVPP